MAYTIASLDELGEGYGFRKIRKALGVTAFGVNALVFPPNYEGPAHYHDVQDELYFVHRGTATFEFDGDEHIVGEGGLVHVESTTHRRVSNRTEKISSSSSSVARTAMSSATASSSAPTTSRSGKNSRNERADDGHQLTLPILLRRAEAYFGAKEIVTRLPDKSFHRYTYRERPPRRALAVGLRTSDCERGDRVATLCWNHYQHHEAYLGIPCGGFVLHTLNLRCTRTTWRTSRTTRATRP